jgi:hypothetical protein
LIPSGATSSYKYRRLEKIRLPINQANNFKFEEFVIHTLRGPDFNFVTDLDIRAQSNIAVNDHLTRFATAKISTFDDGRHTGLPRFRAEHGHFQRLFGGYDLSG